MRFSAAALAVLFAMVALTPAFAGEGVVNATPLSGLQDKANVNDSHSTAGGKRTQSMDGAGNDCSAGHPCPVGDSNNAPFLSAATITVGAGAIAAGRTIAFLVAADCNLSLHLAGGSDLVIAVSGSPYTQFLPFSATAINTSGTTCTGTFTDLY